ncbi:MAG: hypothetical protein KJ922_00405, partial [Nanoarchaeota archaeon]|nr:hypothetical protein [Nanoarchaeota archaeon]
QAYEDAQESYKKAMSMQSENWQAHEALANLYSIKKEYKRSLAEIDQALKKAPEQYVSNVVNKKAYIYFEMGENKNAVAVWKQILNMNIGDGQSADKIRRIIGVLES